MSKMDKSYSNCPLKKRPIYVIEEEVEEVEKELEQVANLEIDDETQPVDLSAAKRCTNPVDIYTGRPTYYRNEIGNNYRISQLSPVKEEEAEQYHQIPNEDHFCYTSPRDWHRRDMPYDHQPLRIYEQINTNEIHYPSQISPTRSDLLSPHENSISPPPSQPLLPIVSGRYMDYARDYPNSRINHNNNIIKSDGHFLDHRHMIMSNNEQSLISPIPSHISYSSNHSTYNSYSEPEDLSVNKNKRKVLVLTDSSANIQWSRKECPEKSSNDLYYQCQNCSKCYSTYSGLIKHQQCHSIPEDLRSNSNQNESQIITTTVPNSSGHIKMHRDRPSNNNNNNNNNNKTMTAPRYQCHDCGKSYSTYSGLTKHQQFHCPAAEGNQVKKLFSCKNCDKVYVSLGALKMHIRTHTLPCKCPLCGKAFSRPWLLQGHIRTHTGEKPFSCQHCHRAFADRSNLRAHLQTHSDIKKYSCTSCSKTFSRMSLLTKHLQGGCAGTTVPTILPNQSYLDDTIYNDPRQHEHDHHHYLNPNEHSYREETY